MTPRESGKEGLKQEIENLKAYHPNAHWLRGEILAKLDKTIGEIKNIERIGVHKWVDIDKVLKALDSEEKG